MDPLVLRDSLSVTGVDTPGSAMAVGSNGQIIFKKSATELYHYDVHEMSTSTLKLSKKFPLYDDCQISDLCFSRGLLLLCLVRPSNGEMFVCEAAIDHQHGEVDIGGAVHRTKIFATRGRTVRLISDEAGAVLVSYPINWQPTGNTVELFHASNYMQSKSGDKYTISLVSKDKIDAPFGCAFISRNHLYLFYSIDYSKFLLVPLAGPSCGKCEIRTTQGIPPSSQYLGKSVQVFEDFALIYAYMNSQKDSKESKKPNLYMMNLTNLKWCPLNLTLSHHFPNSKIAFQKCGEELIYLHGDCNQCGEELIYLHGDCNQVGCPERSHLYQVNVDAVGALLMTRVRSQSFTPLGCNSYPSVSSCSVPNLVHRTSSVCSQTPPSTPTLNMNMENAFNCKSDPPVVQRFKKKQSKDENAKRRYSTALTQKTSSSSMNSFDDEKSTMKRTPSCSSLHWCADMEEQKELPLQEQLKLAADMGYSQDVVIAALNLSQADSRGPYKRFDSTNMMLDLLSTAGGRGDPNGHAECRGEPSKMKLSIYNEKDCNGNAPRSSTPRSSSVSRSSSFHIGGSTSRPARHENHDLFRLIHTLDREKERDKENVEQQFKILGDKIHTIEREKDELRTQNERLTAELQEQKEMRKVLDADLLVKCEQVSKLEEEATEMRLKFDRLTIDNLHLERDISQHKELLEHRQKKHDEEMKRHAESLVALESQMESVQKELTRKSALLDEQTNIARRMEERHTNLQSTVLLETISKRYEEISAALAQLTVHHGQMISQFPVLEAKISGLEKELDDTKRKAKDDGYTLRREIGTLMEKSQAECCICLSTKPSVVFLPCRHLVACGSCVDDNSMTECPACRAKIDDNLKIYS